MHSLWLGSYPCNPWLKGLGLGIGTEISEFNRRTSKIRGSSDTLAKGQIPNAKSQNPNHKYQVPRTKYQGSSQKKLKD